MVNVGRSAHRVRARARTVEYRLHFNQLTLVQLAHYPPWARVRVRFCGH